MHEPSIYAYLDADVWIQSDAEGNRDVAYTQDVLEALLEQSESDNDRSDDSD